MKTQQSKKNRKITKSQKILKLRMYIVYSILQNHNYVKPEKVVLLAISTITSLYIIPNIIGLR